MIAEWLQIVLILLPVSGVIIWLVYSFQKDGFDGLKSFDNTKTNTTRKNFNKSKKDYKKVDDIWNKTALHSFTSVEVTN